MKTFNSFFNKVLMALLAFLGFSSCREDPWEEYGTPHATYKLIGTVVDEDKHPIQNVQIYESEYSYYDIQDSTVMNLIFSKMSEKAKSDEKGNFQVSADCISNQIIVRFMHEGYEKIDTVFNYKDEKYVGGKGWYSGEATKEVNINMKKVKSNDK